MNDFEWERRVEALEGVIAVALSLPTTVRRVGKKRHTPPYDVHLTRLNEFGDTEHISLEEAADEAMAAKMNGHLKIKFHGIPYELRDRIQHDLNALLKARFAALDRASVEAAERKTESEQERLKMSDAEYGDHLLY